MNLLIIFKLFRFCPEFSFFILIFAIANSTACHNFQQLQQLHAAHARGVASATNSPQISLDQSVDKCYYRSPPYNAEEILAASTLYPLADALPVSAGGRITCGFDDEREYCSWHNALDADLKFSQARRNTFFDLDRFDCTYPRPFFPVGYFLLVKGDASGYPRKAVLETTIPCQYDPAVIRFDIWSINDSPSLRYCLGWANGTASCENAVVGPNPLNFTIPHSIDPTSIRIEIQNINSQDIVLIDNIYHEGRICELMEEDETTGTTVETLVSISPLAIEPQLSIHKISRDVSEDSANVEATIEGPSQGATEIRQDITTNNDQSARECGRVFSPIIDEDRRSDIATSLFAELESPNVKTLKNPVPTELTQLLELNSETFGKASDFVACEALACDFNHNHSCFYNLNGLGSTSPWLIGTAFVGNRHTGIQRLNQEDSSRVGFAYVGKDHVDESNEIFVMESPKFTLSTNASLLFDVYLRSHSPHLKVCIDSFDNCSYESPAVSAHDFWLLNNAVELPRGVRKVGNPGVQC